MMACEIRVNREMMNEPTMISSMMQYQLDCMLETDESSRPSVADVIEECHKSFPRRSKSADKPLVRSPLESGQQLRQAPRRTQSSPMKLALYCQVEEVPLPPSPLCRWSSLAPREISPATSSTCMRNALTPSRSRSLRNISMLPPRMPSRRSGRAEELRSALPPRVPMRKPGDALIESHALPPYMPKRKFDESSEQMSLVNYTRGYPSASEDEEVGNDFDDLSSLSEDGDHLYCEEGRIASKGICVKENLERVLGEVLEQLNDDIQCEGF